jgi:hypothetical protein
VVWFECRLLIPITWKRLQERAFAFRGRVAVCVGRIYSGLVISPSRVVVAVLLVVGLAGVGLGFAAPGAVAQADGYRVSGFVDTTHSSRFVPGSYSAQDSALEQRSEFRWTVSGKAGWPPPAVTDPHGSDRTDTWVSAALTKATGSMTYDVRTIGSNRCGPDEMPERWTDTYTIGRILNPDELVRIDWDVSKREDPRRGYPPTAVQPQWQDATFLVDPYSTCCNSEGCRISDGPAYPEGLGIWLAPPACECHRYYAQPAEYEVLAGTREETDTGYRLKAEKTSVTRHEWNDTEYTVSMQYDLAFHRTGPSPNTTIRGPRINQAKRNATFRFYSSEGDRRSTFRCKLDGKPAGPCETPKTYRRLKPGRHRFKVWAIDWVGNVDPTPAVKVFRIIRS